MNDPRHPSIPPVGSNPPVARPQMQQPVRPPVQPMQPARPMQAQPVRPGAPAPTARPAPADEPISLVEDIEELVEEKPGPGNPGIAPVPSNPNPVPSKIKFGPDIGHKQHNWKRKPHVSGTGACRLRSFHAKYSDQGLENLDNHINEWLDDHPEIEIKFCTTTVHVFEGKIREPAIVMNLWY